MLISFSGLDCSGKGTQIAALVSLYNEQKIVNRVFWARPGYTPLFNYLKSKTVSRNNKNFQDLEERKKNILRIPLLLRVWIYISILDLVLYWGVYLRVQILIKPRVIADRYIVDAFVDLTEQFPEVDIKNLLLWRALEFLAPKPTASIFMLINPEIAIARSKRKIEPFSNNITSLRKRYQIYELRHTLAHALIDINAAEKPEFITAEIFKSLNEDNNFEN